LLSLGCTISVGICHIAALFLFGYDTKLFLSALVKFGLKLYTWLHFLCTFSVGICHLAALFLFGDVTELFFLHFFIWLQTLHMALPSFTFLFG
jgi:hypothetical protein